MTILVTGAAGFIGFNLAKQLLAQGKTVIGIDNLSDYYDVNLKKARLAELEKNPQFHFSLLDIADQDKTTDLFNNYKFDTVVNLAAQAGVRYSITHPQKYIEVNVQGFCNILESCRHSKVKHLVFASSSSVYGANTQQPLSEHQGVNHPLTLYAATKKANEMMAHSYANLFHLPCTGLRFFTVYGPWGRPDMVLFKFTKNILAGLPIEVYNHGDMVRDFTYIDDIVSGIISVIKTPALADPNWTGLKPDPATSYAPYRIYNIGNNNPVKLMDFIAILENALHKKAICEFKDMQIGDVPATYADIETIGRDLNFKPNTSLEAGINQFVAWYREYYKV